jgi:NTE family protein
MRACILALLLVVGLSGCATSLDNAPLNRPASGAPAPPPPRSDDDHEQVIGLSLSGGGLRAAAFALGALRELAEGSRDVYGDVRFVSSVSGGSLAGAYLGLRGRPGLQTFRDAVLLRDFERELRLSLWSPQNVMRLLAGGLNDRSNLAQVLDRDVFQGASFADLYRAGHLDLWINATDLFNRTPFPFTPQVFGALCSDLPALRLSEAVAASMAVPLAFAPVVLQTFPEACQAPLPAWAARAAQDRGGVTAGLLSSVARAMANYRNPERLRYVKLADGGLTDNQGLSSILVARAAAGTPHDPITEANAVRLRRLLFLVVDAGRPPTGSWALQAGGPSGVEVGLAAVDAALDSATRLSMQAFRDEMARWRDQIVRFRCALPPERVRALVPPGRAWACDDLVFEVDVLSFEGLPSGLEQRLREMPTRLTLPAADVDAAIEAGRVAARGSAALARYRSATPGAAPPARR